MWPVIQERMKDLRNFLVEAPNSIDQRLAAAGLTGTQLEMKLDAHLAASLRAREARPQAPIGFRKIFKSLLG